MSRAIERYRQPQLDRRTSQALIEISRQAVTQRAIDQAQAELARGRISDIESVAQHGMLAVTEIAAWRTVCASRSPEAAADLAYLARIAAAGIGSELDELRRR